jgi:very-short-patch-repair endonuclease
MRPRAELPVSLPGAFTRATAAAHGVGASRLRGPDVSHPFHGVSTTVDVDLVGAYRIRMLPGQFFTHQTAAALFGMPLPEEPTRVHVGVPHQRTPPRGSGVVGHRVAPHVTVMKMSDGTPVCSPADAWCQLAADLNVPDLVAAADHLLGARKRPAIATIEHLAGAAQRFAGGRGSRKRESALARIRWGSDSRPESLLRLLLEDQAIGDVLVNEPIRIRGRRLHPDLTVPSRRLILEYEGDHHRTDRPQWTHDIGRHNAFAAAGWTVLRVTAHDLFVTPQALAREVRNVAHSH